MDTLAPRGFIKVRHVTEAEEQTGNRRECCCSLSMALFLGHINEDAGFAAACFCQTASSALYQTHPDHLHPHWDLWLLGRKLSVKLLVSRRQHS